MKWIIILIIFVGLSSGATIDDLVNDLERMHENATTDEIIYVVGCAWNYNVSENGIVTLDDGYYDLT